MKPKLLNQRQNVQNNIKTNPSKMDEVNDEMSTNTAEPPLLWDYFESGGPTLAVNVTVAPCGEEPVWREQTAVLVTYSLLLVVGAVGNVAVLAALARVHRRRSRVDLLMTHLAIADVCVVCGVIPLEIGWKYTNEWLAGNALCKLLQVMRAFGLYLSSNILVCISLDRFFAVIYPLRLTVARRRSKQMLYCAWATALACSLPQSIVFRVMRHPRIAGFEQCVAFEAFSSQQQEVAYNVFCMCAMYFLPLVVITVCYVCIFCEIRRSSKELHEKFVHGNGGVSHVRLRRSDHSVLDRARRRTLRMTVTIVSVFALCWLPYATMAMWYMVDRASASHVSPRLQDLLFAMAVSNSCMNPLVYGSFTLDLRGTITRFFQNTCCKSTASSDTIGNSGSSSARNRNNNAETPLVNPIKIKRTQHGVRFAETSFTTPAPAATAAAAAAAAGERDRSIPRTPRGPA